MRCETIEDAGHWPWLDRPDLIATVTDFVAAWVKVMELDRYDVA